VVEDFQAALLLAETVGYPVILKAKDGGGGKGMRVVTSASDLERQFNLAQNEAAAAFGNGALYLEKYLQAPRHVEIQVAGDRQGNAIHLFERDCSIQRRHQKLIEESPSPGLEPKTRAAMGEVACAGVRQIGYLGLGTMEFLLDRDGSFYFMEMNTRLQVEHPVTEMVTGRDLVKLQIRVAAGEPIPFTQEEVVLRGHAIECRINAENPEQGFRPCPGKVSSFHVAGGPGIRMDSHVYAGYTIPSHYDSLMGKLIAHGADRREAIARMLRALAETEILGVDTTIPFHREILADPDFAAGNFDTHFLERRKAAKAGESDERAAAAGGPDAGPAAPKAPVEKEPGGGHGPAEAKNEAPHQPDARATGPVSTDSASAAERAVAKGADEIGRQPRNAP